MTTKGSGVRTAMVGIDAHTRIVLDTLAFSTFAMLKLVNLAFNAVKATKLVWNFEVRQGSPRRHHPVWHDNDPTPKGLP